MPSVKWPFIGRSKDPYWDSFINKAPADPKNLLAPAIAAAQGGPVYGVKTEVHDPGAMAGHLRRFADFLGADLFGIARLDAGLEASIDGDAGALPFAVVCAVRTTHDVTKAAGIGGQLPIQKHAVINSQLRSYIRELGYRATVAKTTSYEVAVAAGLGTVDTLGRFSAPKYGNRLHVGDVVLCDLPLIPVETRA